MAENDAAGRAEKIAAYKSLLRSVIERRPSGMRGRLAMALGKHKSFVSQITNPSYRVPIPASDLRTIFEICHLVPAERERFLVLYRAAHPLRMQRSPEPPNAPHELRITIPQYKSDATAHDVEAMILDFAARTIRLAHRAEQGNGNDVGNRRKRR